MAEREGKEDDRGGTAEVSIWMRKVWFLKKTKKREEEEGFYYYFLPSSCAFSLSNRKFPPGCETYLLSLSLSLSLLNLFRTDIPPKLQNRKNARDRVVRES